MSALFQNAVTSIRLGIEDFETGSEDRMISAARNYYAGILLLAKECLVRAAPEADPLQVIGAKVKPVSDKLGGVQVAVVGWKTVDFHDMKGRFKDFGLDWPEGDFDRLRSLRNEAEHHHLTQPVAALAEAIAASFPVVVDFFSILGEDPKEELGDTWDVILARRAAFEKVQGSCRAQVENIDWPGPVQRLDRMACDCCGSSLIGQQEADNTTPSEFVAQCAQCGDEHHPETSVRMVVEATFEVDAYIAAKEGADAVIEDCPHCGVSGVYVFDGEVNVCYSCTESFGGTCVRCGNSVTVHDHDWDNENLCSYCGYQSAKAMAD